MTTAHNIVPAPGPAFALPSGGGGPTVMTKPWPEWAMLRAEEVREKLPPEQWGPWTNRGQCVVSNTITGSSNQMAPHPTEEPYFFHCKAHLQAIRERNPTVRPWPARDKGRCTSCGAPAARRPVTMADPVACVQAERTNSTVARLSAKRHCDRCNPNRRPLCRGRICRETGQKRRVQRPDAAISPRPASVATVPNAAPPPPPICLLRSCRPPPSQRAPPREEHFGMNAENEYAAYTARVSTIGPSPTDWV